MLWSPGIHPPEVGLMKIKEKRANMRQEQHHLRLLRRISLFFILPPSKTTVAPVVINLYFFSEGLRESMYLVPSLWPLG